jgi:hypothetical protein
MLGRFVPRSIALICDTLSFVSAASCLNEQSHEANHPDQQRTPGG